jgi:hypothetical protein
MGVKKTIAGKTVPKQERPTSPPVAKRASVPPHSPKPAPKVPELVRAASPASATPPPARSPAADANALYQAMRGGLTGQGTDEAALFATLRGKTPGQVQLLRQAYRSHFDRDLDADVKSELSGLALTRATHQLAGRHAEADAVAIKAELGVLGSGQRVLDVLGAASPQERLAIASAFVKQFEPGAADPLAAFQRVLGQNLKGEPLQQAMSLLQAGRAESAAERDAFEAKAAKLAIRTEPSRANAVLDVLTPSQRQLLADDPPFLASLEATLSKPEHDRALATLRGQPGGVVAAQLQEVLGSRLGVNVRSFCKKLGGKSAAELQDIGKAFLAQTGKPLEAAVRQAGLGAEALSIALTALTPNVAGRARLEQDARRLHLAMAGLGTNVAAIRDVLEGKTKAQLDALAEVYRSLYKFGLRDTLKSELSGREAFEVLQLFDKGKVASAEDALVRLEEKARFERGG